MFADYAFYRDEYHGTLEEAEFTRLAVQAEAYLEQLTLGRAGRVPLEEPTGHTLMLAECAVADAMKKNEEGGGVVSESVGRYSVNYATGVSNTGTDATRLRDAARRFLGPTGLMYAGV